MSLRDKVWRRLTVTSLKTSNVIQKFYGPSDDDYVRPILIGDRYPGLGDAPVYLSENTPRSQDNPFSTRIAVKVVLWMKEWFGLGQGFPQPIEGDMPPYPDEYLKVGPEPELPEQYKKGKDLLAEMAQRGPYSMYVTPTGPNTWNFDMSAFESVPTRAPFVPTGGVARLERTEKGAPLKTVSITRGGKTVTPADGEAWKQAELRVMVGLNAKSTFLDHLGFVHLLGAGTWALCTHLALPASHPLAILMQPFIIETMRVNNYNIDGLIKTENSNVPTYTGYTLDTLNSLMNGHMKAFDARWTDAEYRAELLGQNDDPSFPTMTSAVAVWRIFRKFTEAWCQEHLKEIDLETRIWCNELNDKVSNGITGLLGIEDLETELTASHVAHLACAGMFTASVWHFIVANTSRDYELFMNINPPAITANGKPTLGIALEKRNSIAIAGVLRYLLVDDSVYMPTPAMKTLWTNFQNELKAYEASIDPELLRYSVVPSKVPSSVHA